MRLLRALVLVLLAPGALAQAPDFTALVRDNAGAVISISGRPSGVLPDLPLADEDGEAVPRREPPWRGFGAMPEPRALGAGFVIETSGYIITNAHLVTEQEELVVRLADRREFEARVVGLDSPSDIALIKIDAAGLQAVRIGDPASLRPGEWVAAIGSPFGFERSITAGIVSALNRTLPEESLVPFIQTDVAINPGSSGGPLFNARGEVVGVNSVIYSETGGYMGLSFSIPIDVAMDVVRQLRASGKVTRGRIGVRLQEVTTELARAFGLPEAAGAAVVEVFRRGPAERAAIRPGDVILRFDGKRVESNGDLVRLTAAASPGTTVDVDLWRFGAPLRVRVRVQEALVATMPPAASRPDGEPIGLQLAPLDRKQRERLRLESGLLVEHARDTAERAGLLRGDVIVSVNGKAMASAEAFYAELRAASKGATVALLVQRQGIRQFVPLRVPR